MAFINEKNDRQMFDFYNQFCFKSDGFYKPLVAVEGDDWWVNKSKDLYFLEAGQMKDSYKKYYLV